MYSNIGKKIKGLAIVTACLLIVASICYGLFIMGAGILNSIDQEEIISAFIGLGMGVLVMIAGSLAAWISQFTLYGFGELIDKTAQNAETAEETKELLEEHLKKIEEELAKPKAAPAPAAPKAMPTPSVTPDSSHLAPPSSSTLRSTFK